MPVGLWDMGLVTHLEVSEGVITLRIRPTFPGCLFMGHFDHEVRSRLNALPWCSAVVVEMDSSTIWTEEDMAPRARRLLEKRRAGARVMMTSGR
jgi:ring-1,2-phenylacetyl-CoA epoxidase subunit PaaD